jgi:hypothetical protein
MGGWIMRLSLTVSLLIAQGTTAGDLAGSTVRAVGQVIARAGVPSLAPLAGAVAAALGTSAMLANSIYAAVRCPESRDRGAVHPEQCARRNLLLALWL